MSLVEITIQKKSLGRQRKLNAVKYELPQAPKTLRELLQMLVTIEVTRYNGGETVLEFVTTEQEQHLEDIGAVKFTTITERTKVDAQKSIETMEVAFEDGLFKVIQNGHIYKALNEKIASNDSQWTFIKLSFLTGR